MTDIRFEQFNDQQKAAVSAVVAWYKGWQDRRHYRQFFRMGGYAGTGKTTIAQHIATLCGGESKVVFIAPTGKAAARLRQKGCTSAQTMHSFIYNVRGEDADGEPIFSAKGGLDQRPKLVIMDEASMVGEYDRKVLASHGIPILELGDPGQIPPVKDTQVFTLDALDVLLDQIERNAGNIIKASMFIRQGKRLPVREYDDVRVRDGRPPDDAICEHLEAITDEQMIDDKRYYNRLLINVPPGAMKSLLVNVLWPAWEWGPKNMPYMRYVCASHAMPLAIRDSIKEHPFYDIITTKKAALRRKSIRHGTQHDIPSSSSMTMTSVTVQSTTTEPTPLSYCAQT